MMAANIKYTSLIKYLRDHSWNVELSKMSQCSEQAYMNNSNSTIHGQFSSSIKHLYTIHTQFKDYGKSNKTKPMNIKSTKSAFNQK